MSVSREAFIRASNIERNGQQQLVCNPCRFLGCDGWPSRHLEQLIPNRGRVKEMGGAVTPWVRPVGLFKPFEDNRFARLSSTNGCLLESFPVNTVHRPALCCCGIGCGFIGSAWASVWRPSRPRAVIDDACVGSPRFTGRCGRLAARTAPAGPCGTARLSRPRT
jgi:hypothetical protein